MIKQSFVAQRSHAVNSAVRILGAPGPLGAAPFAQIVLSQ
jgi:hypothetical protein